MKNYTEDLLIKEGYKIENAKIKNFDLSMADHGCLVLNMALEGRGWGSVYGGYVLGHGYLGAKEFDGSSKGIECLMRIMDTIGVEKTENIPGQYIRVAVETGSGPVAIIGNLIKDKWFDQESFFNEI